ncbi:unnamed protein product [Pylaiella littoralis]
MIQWGMQNQFKTNDIMTTNNAQVHQELKTGQIQLTTGLLELNTGLQTVAQGFTSRFVSLEDSMEDLRKELASNQSSLSDLRKETTSNQFKRGKRSQFLPYLPVLFDGETGECGWVPTGFTDSSGTYLGRVHGAFLQHRVSCENQRGRDRIFFHG